MLLLDPGTGPAGVDPSVSRHAGRGADRTAGFSCGCDRAEFDHDIGRRGWHALSPFTGSSAGSGQLVQSWFFPVVALPGLSKRQGVVNRLAVRSNLQLLAVPREPVIVHSSSRLLCVHITINLTGEQDVGANAVIRGYN